jgi:hypothetical protein
MAAIPDTTLTDGELVEIHWQGASNGTNKRRAKFVRHVKRKGEIVGALVRMQNVTPKGEYRDTFGSERRVETGDIIGRVRD